jgi:type 1 glutamine amidotransferase
MLQILLTLTVLALVLIGPPAHAAPLDDPPAETHRILIFSRTAGFRHDSIIDGVQALRTLARHAALEAHATEDPAIFTRDALQPFRAIIFLNTTGAIFSDDQKAAFQHFIRSGGGFVGIHAAADTEHDWPWYGDLVGAHFKSHPAIQQADIIIEDPDHPATRHLPTSPRDGAPARWTRTDEWYDYKRSPRGRGDIRILLTLDESTYKGGRMGDDHPIAWCHEFDGGRAFYTGLGHTRESFAEPAFLQHLLGGITWAVRIDDAAALDTTHEAPATP